MGVVLPGWFGRRIYDVDRSAAQIWGSMNKAADRNAIDALIAATARARGLIVVARNARDFDGLGVPVLTSWT